MDFKQAIEEVTKLVQLQNGAQLTIPNANIPVVCIPNGWKVETLPGAIHNEFSEFPSSLSAVRNFKSPDSFIDYVNRFADAHTIILANPDNFTLLAILDYHVAHPEGDHSPRWGKHVAKLTLSKSEQLEAWLLQNGKLMEQMEFAEFLQENAADIEQPSAAEMLTIARDLRATVGMSAVGTFNQATGETEFSYKTEVNASAGVKSTKIEIPERFYLRLPLFANDAPSGVICDFRYRAGEKMKLMYKLYQVNRLLEARFGALVETINAALEKPESAILIGS